MLVTFLFFVKDAHFVHTFALRVVVAVVVVVVVVVRQPAGLFYIKHSDSYFAL